MRLFTVPAVLFKERVERVEERHALGVVPRGHFGEQQRGRDCVLVAHVVADHVAVALLVGEDDGVFARALKLIHLLGHELKARERVVAVEAVRLRHGARHLGRDDSLERGGIRGQLARALHRTDQIVEQQHARLVAGDRLELALLVAHHDTDAVAVGVGAEDEVDVVLLGEVNGEVEALGILGVRGHDGREIAVDDHLLGYA